MVLAAGLLAVSMFATCATNAQLSLALEHSARDVHGDCRRPLPGPATALGPTQTLVKCIIIWPTAAGASETAVRAAVGAS